MWADKIVGFEALKFEKWSPHIQNSKKMCISVGFMCQLSSELEIFANLEPFLPRITKIHGFCDSNQCTLRFPLLSFNFGIVFRWKLDFAMETNRAHVLPSARASLLYKMTRYDQHLASRNRFADHKPDKIPHFLLEWMGIYSQTTILSSKNYSISIQNPSFSSLSVLRMSSTRLWHACT